MKLKSLIIDDEPLAHKVVLAYAKDVDFIEIVGQCHLATEALSFLKENEVDLIFLDIQMPKLTGLDFLKTLQKKPLVIITSAYQEYALESYDLDVCDYLLKPFRFDRFLKAVNKAFGLFQLTKDSTKPNKEIAPSVVENVNQLFIKSDKKLINIAIDEIYYLESYGNYVKIWMDKQFHLTPKTLSSFVEQLPVTDYFKIHKSFIINRKFIDYVEGNFVLMKNGSQLPIGKSHRSAFKEFLG